MQHRKNCSCLDTALATPRFALLRQIIRNYYHSLQAEFACALQDPEVDWFRLMELNDRITEMEQRAPWLLEDEVA